MILTITEKIDAVVKSARIMGIEFQELFFNQKDWNEIRTELEKNTLYKKTKESTVIEFQSIVGIIKLSRKE